MAQYNASEVESKWQKKWEESGLHSVDLKNSKKEKFYNLVMFPYPSGDKLHVGHWYNYAPADSYGRYMRMKGYNVLEPLGFDSFGLPAENYAIKTGVHPHQSITQNVNQMITQLKRIGTIYDWDKTIVTSTPEYYKWTQWLFLQLYKKGLAFKKFAPVNWCPSCKTVLANEQVQDGTCDRCKSEVTKRDLAQWMFKLSAYAEKLLDFEGLDWPEKTITMQKNWIGKSTGSEITFKAEGIEGSEENIIVYTTRIDTLFGCTYMVLAPEHPLVPIFTTTEQKKNVKQYIEKAKKITDIERSSEVREKTGVFTGSYAINPVNGEKVPIWIADYVLVYYGTGAVMAVPTHDERDYAFAKKYDLPLRIVIADKKQHGEKDGAYCEDGVLINSGTFDGMSSEDARLKITEFLAEKKAATFRTNYRLRDWLLSRQRYWGAPIPIVNCKKCGEVPVLEKDLPVELPNISDFTPLDDGKSPLSKCEEFKNCKCPKCGGPAERETDTMDTFVCSSWYYLRYPNNKLADKPFDKAMMKKWLPVDMYIGGPEHACMHLIYARFINMVMHDLGFVDFKEPFKKLVHQGMITKDGAKMSKSKGNVVSPDEFVEKYGSDVFRMYLMFMGPFQDGGDWNDKGITGISRFVERFWNLVNGKSAEKDSEAVKKALHKLIKKVGEDIETLHFNTAVAAMMEFVNLAMKEGVCEESKKILVKLIAPMAPHLAEECFEGFGEKGSVIDAPWPKYDEKMTVDNVVRLGVQVNGKVRGDIEIEKTTDQKTAIEMAKANPNVAKYLENVTVVKEIYVPGKIIGFVVK
ncbi:MAG: leucine--tRNA ligase [Candidatus Gracilibacteria bacterium]|nr:leucine--tRNA ligase [Candidatus Gracilibacteria bacterium]